jgi:hypothetical protein
MLESQDIQQSALKKDFWIIAIVVIAMIGMLAFTDIGKSRTITYDCRDAHWHPDYPIDVKEECRRLMHEYYQKEQKTTKKYLTSA